MEMMGCARRMVFRGAHNEMCGPGAKIFQRKRKRRKMVCDKKPLLWADKNSRAGQELCGRYLRLTILPKQNTSADKPDCLNQHHKAEAVHVEPDMTRKYGNYGERPDNAAINPERAREAAGAKNGGRPEHNGS